MKTAKFKAIPNYEYNRDGVYALFNGEGVLVTNDEKVIEALEKAKPFVQSEEKPAPEKPKAKPKQK
ncbi:hypothetical protein [Cytobacillus purgationiresistens]|uniref:Uncharacterized protein n=1 Tax=Cytobacillus purgationiresistens TaxID=863449 RepID=A0ABU0AHJ9_9BACI|nr:hypothetical protein [Cytobacillus purgationiresistens]MDQ0270729.1 hypothetical protein [Cytobacillus purgationiresistens]